MQTSIPIFTGVTLRAICTLRLHHKDYYLSENTDVLSDF